MKFRKDKRCTAWICSDPVSYTHLDVYKRQVWKTQGDILCARRGPGSGAELSEKH